jgi:hypothetical protein
MARTLRSGKQRGSISGGAQVAGNKTVAEVFDLRTGRRLPIPMEDYLGMVDTLEKYLKEAHFRNQQKIIWEIRWNATFSRAFREDTRDELRAIIDEMYEYVHEL